MISKTYISNRDAINCRINTETGLIAMRELSYFQYLFIATYSLAYDVTDNTKILNTSIQDVSISEIEKIIVSMKNKLFNSNSLIVSQYARSHIPENDDLYIEDICRENPINITFKGISLILVVAIVISGGKIEISKDTVKAELPPLGQGIYEIKKALYSKEFDVNMTKRVVKK